MTLHHVEATYHYQIAAGLLRVIQQDGTILQSKTIPLSSSPSPSEGASRNSNTSENLYWSHRIHPTIRRHILYIYNRSLGLENRKVSSTSYSREGRR